MNLKLTLAIIFVLLGAGTIGASLYIKNEVNEGKRQIANGQQKVDTGKSLFSITPETKRIGGALTKGAQSQIDQGRRDVAYYESISNWLMGIGIAAGLIGLVLLFTCKRR